MNNTKFSAPTGKIVRLGDGAFITVFMNGESLTLRKSESEKNFELALNALQAEDWDALYQAMRPVKFFVTKVDNIEVKDNGVYFDGEPLHNAIATRIMDFALAGLDHAPLCKFLNKLMLNPSRRAINELYTFLEHQFLPVTDNGNFLAYKGILSNFYSITSGTAKLIKGKVNANGQIYNGIGEEIEMRRNDVDDNKDVGCSYGLHAGSLDYATNFARGKVVIVEINPKDVVSIPTDCSFQKLRTCAYRVVDEYEGALTAPLYQSRWKDEQDTDDIGDDLVYDFRSYDPDICFETPDSSWMQEVKYWSDEEVMDIYLNDGGVITLSEISWDTAEDFQTAVEDGESAGQYYHRNLK